MVVVDAGIGRGRKREIRKERERRSDVELLIKMLFATH